MYARDKRRFELLAYIRSEFSRNGFRDTSSKRHIRKHILHYNRTLLLSLGDGIQYVIIRYYIHRKGAAAAAAAFDARVGTYVEFLLY